MKEVWKFDCDISWEDFCAILSKAHEGTVIETEADWYDYDDLEATPRHIKRTFTKTSGSEEKWTVVYEANGEQVETQEGRDTRSVERELWDECIFSAVESAENFDEAENPVMDFQMSVAM